MAVAAVIYDFFGVLCVGSRGIIVSRTPEASRERMQELFQQADYGFLTAAEFSTQAAELLSLSPDAFQALMQRQYARDDEMLASIRRVKQACRTALLSNANDTVINELFTLEERAELFDAVIVSSDVGMVKPQKELFSLAATRLGVLPEECVMIDDMASNIEGAQRADMDGIVFENRAQYQRELLQRGVYA